MNQVIFTKKLFLGYSKITQEEYYTLSESRFVQFIILLTCYEFDIDTI